MNKELKRILFSFLFTIPFIVLTWFFSSILRLNENIEGMNKMLWVGGTISIIFFVFFYYRYDLFIGKEANNE